MRFLAAAICFGSSGIAAAWMCASKSLGPLAVFGLTAFIMTAWIMVAEDHDRKF